MFLIDGVRVDIRIILQFVFTCIYIHYWDFYLFEFSPVFLPASYVVMISYNWSCVTGYT